MTSPPIVTEVRRPSIWLIYSITLAGILANSLVTPNIPDILADLGQPDSRAGLLVASGPSPGIVLAPVVGVLADRFGRRQVLLPCLVVFTIGGLGAAIAPTFGVLIAARLVQGVGSAGLINLAVVLIADNWEGETRTRLIGRNSAVLTMALAILPSVSGLVASVSSWRWSLGLSGLAAVVAAAVAIKLPNTVPEAARTLGAQLQGARRAIRDPRVLTALIAGFLLFVVIFGVFLTALPVHLENEFGLGPGARGLVLSSSAAGAAFASFNVARVRAIIPLRRLLVLSSVGIAIASLGVGLSPVIIGVVIAKLLYGLGDGLTISTLQDVVASAPAAEDRASVIAAWVSSVRLGQVVGPLAASALFAATSTSFAMVAGAALFGVVALMFTVAPIEAQPDQNSATP